MTEVYFVRHCQSQKGWKESDSIRPLTTQGQADSALVTEALHGVLLDYCMCSPYLRSMDTIRGCAEDHGLVIHTDARFGERIGGRNNDEAALIRRWQERDYHEEGGESISSVQRRNIEGLHELLTKQAGKRVLFGTHGTALTAMLNYYEPAFGYEGFKMLYSWMPYIIHATFDGVRLVRREDVLVVDRGYGAYGSV